MKKAIITLGMLASLSASALVFNDVSQGLKDVAVPSGIATSYDTRTWDNSDKYEQSFLGTVNVEATHQVLLNDGNLLRINATISTGYHSEALTVQPYIKPRIELVSQVGDSSFLLFNADLNTIGGNISEKIWYDKNGLDFSYATARPWSEYEGAKFADNSVGVTYIYKF